MTETRRLVNKLVGGSNVLRDAGVNMYEYTEQLTFLLFLKMAEERATRSLNPERVVPEEYSWPRLIGQSGEGLEDTYNHILRGLSSQSGVLGAIYRGAQNRISSPSHLKTLIVDYLDKENWSAARTLTATRTRSSWSGAPGTRRRPRASTSRRAR